MSIIKNNNNNKKVQILFFSTKLVHINIIFQIYVWTKRKRVCVCDKSSKVSSQKCIFIIKLFQKIKKTKEYNKSIKQKNTLS